MKTALYTEANKFLESNPDASPLRAYQAGFDRATHFANQEIDALTDDNAALVAERDNDKKDFFEMRKALADMTTERDALKARAEKVEADAAHWIHRAQIEEQRADKSEVDACGQHTEFGMLQCELGRCQATFASQAAEIERLRAVVESREKALTSIRCIGMGRDGEHTAKRLGNLVDELYAIASREIAPIAFAKEQAAKVGANG
jgi:chromosome segregation ATPase